MKNDRQPDFSQEFLKKGYEIQQQLARKAGRRTLLAKDLNSQELVVIKLLAFSNDFSWEDLKLFEREAQTLQTLEHPAIPDYIDYFELDTKTGKTYALVQSYIEGKSLEEILEEKGKFTESEIKNIAKSLLEILIYLHRRQPPLIHRDIKPSNIIVAERPYLVDFGSVKTTAQLQGGTMTVVGTYGYVPMEQFAGRTEKASDLYALGATLIHLITGTNPADLPHKNSRLDVGGLFILLFIKLLCHPGAKALTSKQEVRSKNCLDKKESRHRALERLAIFINGSKTKGLFGDS